MERKNTLNTLRREVIEEIRNFFRKNNLSVVMFTAAGCVVKLNFNRNLYLDGMDYNRKYNTLLFYSGENDEWLGENDISADSLIEINEYLIDNARVILKNNESARTCRRSPDIFLTSLFGN